MRLLTNRRHARRVDHIHVKVDRCTRVSASVGLVGQDWCLELLVVCRLTRRLGCLECWAQMLVSWGVPSTNGTGGEAPSVLCAKIPMFSDMP